MPNRPGEKRLKRLRASLSDKLEMKDGRRAPMVIGLIGDGKLCVVVRHSDQIFRGGAKTLNQARIGGTLCWMIDRTLVPFLMQKGVDVFATLELETGILWAGPMSDWTDPDKLFHPPIEILATSYRGAANVYLPVTHMREFPCKGRLSL